MTTIKRPRTGSSLFVTASRVLVIFLVAALSFQFGLMSQVQSGKLRRLEKTGTSSASDAKNPFVNAVEIKREIQIESDAKKLVKRASEKQTRRDPSTKPAPKEAVSNANNTPKHRKRFDTKIREDFVSMFAALAPQPIKDRLKVSTKDAETKREALQLIADAGIEDVDEETVAQLPTSNEIKSLYGDGPVILGLETCEAFRKNTPPSKAHVGVAGMFNTGTNALEHYARQNCRMPLASKDNVERGMHPQVPWGKHTLASRKWVNTAKKQENVNKNHTLPVVMVRDPLHWMHSMCKNPYLATWKRSKGHCPNLVPTPRERVISNQDTVKATILYSYKKKEYDSLVEMWNGWNREYLEADYPRLMIRLEDLQLYPKQVMDAVCQCVGAVPRHEDSSFVYVKHSAKVGWDKKKPETEKKPRSNLLTGIIKSGSNLGRYKNMTQDDVRYAVEHLDHELMELFQYNIQSEPSSSTL